MENKIYVGNLNYKTTEDALQTLFEQAGTVNSVRVISDSAGRSRGFAFVEMSSEDEVSHAIETLNEAELDGRNLVVSKARPKRSREQGGPRGGRGGYGRDNGRSGPSWR